MARLILSHRETDDPFEVVDSGVTPGDNPTRAPEIVRSFADAGVTWWLEPIAPYRYDEGVAETVEHRETPRAGPPGTTKDLNKNRQARVRHVHGPHMNAPLCCL